MKIKLYPIFILCLMLAVLIQACSPVLPEAEPAREEPISPDDSAPEGVLMARDAVLNYVQQTYGVPGLTSLSDWIDENVTPADLVGQTTYEFISGNWMVTVSFPVVAPGNVIYTVNLINPVSNFKWVGTVDANGIVSDVDQTEYPSGSGLAPGERLKSPEDARNAALAFVYNRYVPDATSQTPPAEINWSIKEISGLVGASAFEFTSTDWIIIVTAPASAPLITFTVEITSLAYGFTWAGTVDSLGQIIENRTPQPVENPMPAPEGTIEVIGWYGNIESLPAGGQWDDKLVLGNNAGEIGVEGSTAALQAEIVSLRDKEEPGKYVHFWGILNCGLPDVGSCQLLVTKLRSGITYTEAEPVIAWQGRLFNNPIGSQFDNYFVSSGDFPVGFGMHSLDPAIQVQLDELSLNGKEFKIWGVLRTGIPDSFGSQIQVDKIEILP